jgi:predicted phosphodiesterase
MSNYICLSMKRAFRLVSDLHLEISKQVEPVHIAINSFNTRVPILCLAGDIGDPRTLAYKSFIKTQSQYYDKVFVIAGNHEYYNSNKKPVMNIKDINDEIETICKLCSNVSYLNNKYEYYDNIKFIGSTLWSFVEEEYHEGLSRCQDVNRVFVGDKKLTMKQRNKLNLTATQFIEKEIKSVNSDTRVVLTHHAPSFEHCSHSDFAGSPGERLFLNKLDYLFKKPLNVWCFGHTHRPFDTIVNGVRIVNNTFGYKYNHKQSNFNDKIITLIKH